MFPATFQNEGQNMSVSCVICLDSSSRTENFADDSQRGLFPSLPRGQTRGIFFVCFIHIFPCAKFKQRRRSRQWFFYRAGYVVFALMRSWHESLFALRILLFDIDTHSYVVSDITNRTTKKEQHLC